MAEFPNLGKHCSVDHCSQLDFLPFHCDGCGSVYCLEHKVKDDHKCTQRLQQATNPEYNGPKAYSCTAKDCSSKELTPIICEHCHRNFCLSHRHQQDHNCSELKPMPVPNAQTAQHVANILAGKQPAAVKKPLKSVKARQTAARVVLMKLKGKASGDKGIPDNERVFFSVAMPLASKLPAKAYFFSDKWSVGRAIDCIANLAGLHNPNNTGAHEKLRLFAGDGGNLLPVEKTLQDLIAADCAVFSGSSLILETAPSHLTCLPDLQKYTI